MTLHARDAASWKVAAPYVRSGGSWVVALSVHARESGAWKLVAQILSTVAVTNAGAKSNGVAVTLGSTITGGYGTLTYSWARTSFDPGAGNITGSSTGTSVNITAGNDASADFQLTVTDTLTGTIVSGIGTIIWGTPP